MIIVDMIRRVLYKVLLLPTGNQAARACGTDQLCRGLDSGIEGAVHCMRSMWDQIFYGEGNWEFSSQMHETHLTRVTGK